MDQAQKDVDDEAVAVHVDSTSLVEAGVVPFVDNAEVAVAAEIGRAHD